MKSFFAVTVLFLILTGCGKLKHPLVLQTDFGTKDAAVSAMKGVAMGVDANLSIHDLTHEIPAYDVWEAAYRLQQAAPYWPSGTVFVSVVDPGVGTNRRSIVLKTSTGHFFVSPDNGSLTLVAESMGIDEVRKIDEAINRRMGSDSSYTFHGRDVYAFTGAKLASGKIDFEEVGPLLPDSVVTISYQRPVLKSNSIIGNIPILDVQYGNIWTNIHDSLFRQLKVGYGEKVNVQIFFLDSVLYSGEMPFVKTFGEVPELKPLAYMNSLMNFSIALNMGSFADSFKLRSGKEWSILVKRD